MMSFLENIYTAIIQNGIYDILKIMIGFIFARFLYEKYIVDFFWGGWRIKVIKKEGEVLMERDISPTVKKLISNNEKEYSEYLKSVTSPYCWIKTDILSPQSIQSGLLTKDDEQKMIIIDISKNNEPEKNC